MKPDSSNKQRTREAEDMEQQPKSSGPRNATLPFTSEGLEQVRDSHC